ncbi:MAG: tetratricopeptide repeat protein [Pyrinomonadaceae bacterium]
MGKLFKNASRVLVVALCVSTLGAANFASAQSQPSGNPPPKKKKLPAGARGFEQFAGRDASEKLVTGGATRSACKSYEELIECGEGSYGEGEFKQAADAFTQAATMKPEMFTPQYRLGATYEALGDYAKSAEAYKRAVALKLDDEKDSPNDMLVAYYNLGNVLAAANQQQEAIMTYQQLISRLPPLHTPHYNLGLSYVALAEQKEAGKATKEASDAHAAAIKAFEEAVKIKPDYWEAHYNMGLVYSRTEQYPKAIEAFKKTLSLNPEYAPAHYNLGLVYFFLDDRKALAEEQKALQAMKPELAMELAKLIGQ